MSEDKNTPVVQPAPQQERNITDNVLNRINQMVASSTLIIPKNYSPENALKAAWFKLLETKTKKDSQGNQFPVLEYCSKDSIANSLLKMVVNAWDPGKNQCYFIPYGKVLACQGSYFGNKANAKRCGMKDATAQIVYQDDEFEYEINPQTGKIRILKHNQKIDNIQMDKIKGGYVTLIMDDGETDVVIMTMDQIKKAWAMGMGEGKTHNNFTDMMAKKTISNRGFRHIINTSDDSALIDEDDSDHVLEHVTAEIMENANSTEIGFSDHQEDQTLSLQEGIEPVKQEEKIEAPMETLQKDKQPVTTTPPF